MATFDLGRVTPIYKGDYSASAPYELNDVVLYNGNLYWHVQSTPTVGILPTDTTVWKLSFADEGIRAEIRGYADNAQASADSASASKSAAATSASQASASASQAVLSAQTAQTAETGATASAQTASTKASEATASAQSAASSAQTATDKATLASQKAQAASESASLATAKAQAAATSETNAVTAANTATAKASEAAASATSAQEHDESAQQSAVNAQTSATNAAASEAAAKSYAEDSAAYFGAYPTDTVEGEIASFSDGADDIPLKSLVVDIEPVQDTSQGAPSPTNICPISGWTGMTINANGTEIPISWESEAGTVYGGTLDVLTGVLTVDRIMQIVTECSSVSISSTGIPYADIPIFRNSISDAETQSNISSVYKNRTGPAPNDSGWFRVVSTKMFIYDERFIDKTTADAILATEQPVFVYILATPITYQLTPHEVKSRLGTNNIYADTGDTTVEYRADTSTYVAKKIAEAISALS